MGKVSIVVPVYKVEQYIHRCVGSILNQSVTDWELILVDDGSPDLCGLICDEYARTDSRIHVIHQENGGLSAARNAGIGWVLVQCDSHWITFVDSDDWLHKDYLKVLLEAAEKETADIAMCNYIRTDCVGEDKVFTDSCLVGLNTENAYDLYYGMCMTACCKLYRTELFQNVRFPVGKLHEDCYITHLPMFAAGKVAVCDVPLYYYFTNPGSITRMKWSEKRLEEIDAHEVRAAWLKEHGYQDAYKREIEVYVMTIYEHTEVLAKLARTDKQYLSYLRQLRSKLKEELQKAQKLGLYKLEREYLWIYLMAYAMLPVWHFGQWLRQKRG